MDRQELAVAISRPEFGYMRPMSDGTARWCEGVVVRWTAKGAVVSYPPNPTKHLLRLEDMMDESGHTFFWNYR
jgi:hypothetical protein